MKQNFSVIRYGILWLLVLGFMHTAVAQQDTTVFKRYQVDKTQAKKDTSGVSAFRAPVEGDGCTISGNTTAISGNYYTYSLSCGNGTLAEYWTVNCGTVMGQYEDAISIRWNTPGCTSATIRAYRYDGVLLASKTVSITISALSGGSITNASQSIAYNTQPVQLSATSASGGSCTAYSYQWEQSTDNVNFSAIGDATGQNLQPGVLTQTTYFRRKVTCGSAVGYTSNTAVVAVTIAALSGGTINNPSQNVMYNAQPGTINATAATGSTCSSYSYQWESSTDNVYFSTITGATGQNYQPTPLTQTMYYRRKATCNSSVVYTSNTAVITITTVPLNGGCITSTNQTIYYTATPSTITASAASDGICMGNYQYQWQSSSDNIYFTNISGATAQNMPFTGPLSQTTYFQRKTVCGTETKYAAIAIVFVKTTPFENEPRSGIFTRNNCSSNTIGSSVTYVVAAGKHTSTISQADANTKAEQDVVQNGQAYANQNGTCTPIYYNTIQSGTYTKYCSPDYVGSTITYTVPAARYSSTISQADADEKATNDVVQNGQDYANQNGTCTPYVVLNYATTNSNQLTVNYTLNFSASTCFVNWIDQTTGANSGNAGNAGGCSSPRTITLPKFNTYYKVWVTSWMNGTYRHSEQILVRTGARVFYSAAISYTFQRNDCGGNSVGGSYPYSVPQGWRTSTISQADADQKASTDFNAQGQALANQYAGCTWYNSQLSQSFQKQCPTDQTGTWALYTVSANTYTSAISQADADAKAQTDMNQNGQAYADQNGSCAPNTVYAKLYYENMSYYYNATYADVIVRFYSDAACTQPAYPAGLNVFFNVNNSCDANYSDVATAYGNELYLGYQVQLYYYGYSCSPYYGCEYGDCFTDYYLEPNAQYTIVF